MFVINHYVIIYMAGTVATLIACAFGYYIFDQFKGLTRLKERSSFLVLVVIFSVLYVVTFSFMKDLTILSHHSYFDYAVFIECFKNVVGGHGVYATMQENTIPGTGYWFSAHFAPLAYLFSFLFWIWPSFQTINWAHTFLLGLSPVILYLMARSQMSAFGAMCLSLALLLNPTFQYITLYEFDFLRFIIPLGILALGIILTRDSAIPILLVCLAMLLIREDAAFFVFGIGLYLFLVQRKRLIGWVAMVFSVLYLIVIVQIVMPSFRGTENHAHIAAAFFQGFGATVPDIIVNIFQHPLKFLAYLFHPYKSVNYFMLLLPFLFMPLFSMPILLIALPSVMMLSFAAERTYSSYFLYYVSPVLVVVTWAAAIGIKNIVSCVNRLEYIRNVLVRQSSITIERVAFSVLCGAVACSVYFGPSPLSIQFWNKDFSLAPFRTTTFYLDRYRPTFHDVAMRKMARLIPDETSISTEQVLLYDVHRCKSIYMFPMIGKAEYVLIDKKNPRKAYISDNPQQYYDLVEKRPEQFELIGNEDGVYLYKRKKDAPNQSDNIPI